MISDRERKMNVVSGLLERSKDEISLIIGADQETILQHIQGGVTIEKIRTLCQTARPGNNEIKKSAEKKWDEIALRALQKANSFREVREICYSARPGSEAQELSAARLAELCSTFDEAKEACYLARYGSKAEELAREKRNSLALKMVQETTTIEEIRRVFNFAPCGSEAQRLALMKRIDFCSTVDELLEEVKPLGGVERFGNEVEKLFTEKRDNLAIKKVREASTIEEIMMAYYSVRRGSEAEKLAVEKLLQLA